MLSTEGTKDADDYLHSFQMSSCAWFIAEDILSHVPHHEMPVLTFAAITFAKKIKENFNRFLESDLRALKENLTGHLLQASMMPESTPLIVTSDVYLTFVQFSHFSPSVPDTEIPKEQLANESLSSGDSSDSSDYKSPSACPCVPVSLRPRVLSWLKMQQKLAH